MQSRMFSTEHHHFYSAQIEKPSLICRHWTGNKRSLAICRAGIIPDAVFRAVRPVLQFGKRHLARTASGGIEANLPRPSDFLHRRQSGNRHRLRFAAGSLQFVASCVRSRKNNAIAYVTAKIGCYQSNSPAGSDDEGGCSNPPPASACGSVAGHTAVRQIGL